MGGRHSDGGRDIIYDQYSITIDKMPPGVTPEQFLAELAKDPNGTVNNWKFDILNQFSRRVTSHPPQVGDVYDINILGPDDGDVVLVEKTDSHFIFQTIETPDSGRHPESGAREFGYTKNADGSVTFYTLGVFQAAHWGTRLGGKYPQGYSWTEMMNGIGDEIERRGGQQRPDSFNKWTTNR